MDIVIRPFDIKVKRSQVLPTLHPVYESMHLQVSGTTRPEALLVDSD